MKPFFCFICFLFKHLTSDKRLGCCFMFPSYFYYVEVISENCFCQIREYDFPVVLLFLLVFSVLMDNSMATDGAGGKGTWGKLLDTDSNSPLDRKDPNYDSCEVRASLPCSLCVLVGLYVCLCAGVSVVVCLL